MVEDELGVLARAVNREVQVLWSIRTSIIYPCPNILFSTPVRLSLVIRRAVITRPLGVRNRAFVGESGNEYVPVQNRGRNRGQTGDNHEPVDMNRSVARPSRGPTGESSSSSG